MKDATINNKSGHLKSNKSVVARFLALQMAETSFSELPPEFFEGLRTEVEFSQLQIDKLGIFRLGSRNTLRKYGEEICADKKNEFGESGWLYLNRLRKKIYSQYQLKISEDKKKKQQKDKNQQKIEIAELIKLLQIHILGQCKAYVWLTQELVGIMGSDSIDAYTKQRISNCINHSKDLFSNLFEPMQKLDDRQGNVFPFHLDHEGKK